MNEVPAATPVPPRHSRAGLVVMILLTVGYAGLFVFSLLMFATSPFVFDSGDNARNWHAFIMIVLYPILILFSLGLAWFGFRRRRLAWTVTGFALPILYAVAFWKSFS